MTDWAAYRARFPGLSGICHLNAASNSPLSLGAAAAG